MSTILDALRKLQRERAAESPSRDLRGSLTAETPRGGVRRRRGSSSSWVLALLVLAVAGGGYWAYSSGQIDALRARFGGAPADPTEAERLAAIADLEAFERQIEARQGAQPQGESQSATEVEPEPEPAPQVAAPPVEQEPPATPAAPRVDTAETLAERARLEAALANARAAQETQRQAEQAAAAAAAAAAVPPTVTPEPEIVAVKPPEKPVAVAEKPPAVKVKPKPPAAKPASTAKAAPKPAARAEPEADDVYVPSAFPKVRVESIRWHPIPERRVASLQFERQNVPQAHEGDIVAGVLVYRIDPGAVELRIGDSHRVVSPAP